MKKSFFSPATHGFVRVGVGIPELRVADPRFNESRTRELLRQAAANHVSVLVFPELGISGYSLDDLFHQEALLTATQASLLELRDFTRTLNTLAVVGLPVRIDGSLYNCAALLFQGRILGLVPKTYLPNYREFYEKRQFTSGNALLTTEIDLGGETVPIGSDLLFQERHTPGFCLGVEICEDLWGPVPPSSMAALAGACLLINLSAGNATVGKAEYRRVLGASQSGRCLAAYLYSGAGFGESTNDLAWDGHGMIWDNGHLAAETERFADREQLILADIDRQKLLAERMRYTSFADARQHLLANRPPFRRISFTMPVFEETYDLLVPPERFPFVPGSTARRDERCQEAYQIQVQGLTKRLKFSGLQKVVLGISGGLDSTQALIVAARTMDRLDLPRSNILTYTMPGFATSRETHDNALALMDALGTTPAEIDIRPACRLQLENIGHPFATGVDQFDVTFENVQAGERTSLLFRLANLHNALVVGTGDLSELALGWCTYGVGDHMSHYAVNASIPKTLIQHLIRWVADSGELGEDTGRILHAILATEISPELIPGDAEEGGPTQKTQEVIGPYELQDFHLFYLTRYGFSPGKTAFLCHQAWRNRNRGVWPETIPPSERREYNLGAIKKWLRVFLRRFFGNSQFKRTCIPNGPKVGSGGSLSPRGDWRAPSDAEPEVWLHDLEDSVPDI